MKSYIWSIIPVAVFCEETPYQLVRSNIIVAAQCLLLQVREVEEDHLFCTS